MVPDAIILIKTCDACPEQYYAIVDTDDNGNLIPATKVAYLRLRWSRFSVHCPDVDGDVVYTATIGDSGMDGCFESDEERDKHLAAAKDAICTWWWWNTWNLTNE